MVGNSLFAAYYLNFAMGKIDTNIQTQIMQIFSQYNIKHSLSDHVQPKDLFDNNHKLIRLWKQQCLPGDSMIDLIAYQIYFILKYFQEIPLIFDSNAVLLQWLQKLNTSSELLNPVLNGCDEQL